MGANEWVIIGTVVITHVIVFGVWMAKMYSTQQLILKRLVDGDKRMDRVESRLDDYGNRITAHDLRFAGAG